MSALRDLVEKHYAQINSQNHANASEVFSPDVETTVPGMGTVRGIEPFVAYSGAFASGFPDGRINLSRAVESGDVIMVEGRFTGTHTGPLPGPTGTLPPTGRALDLPYCDVFRVANGRIVEHHLYYDQVGFLAQLGLMPAPAMS